MSSSKAKDFRPIITELQRQGWVVTETRGSHYRAKPPDEKRPIVHFAASVERRALRNTIADLRRSGFEWPPEARQSAPFSQNLLPLSPELAPEYPDECASRPGEIMSEEEEQLEALVGMLPDAKFGTVPGLEDKAKPETEEEKMDRLWQELRDARSNFKLAEEIEAEASERLERAKDAMALAVSDRMNAASKMGQAKRTFDAAFEAAA